MYMLLLAAALAVAPKPSYAPPTPAPARALTGRVTDTTGAALADVRVRVLEAGRETTTDLEGKFTLAVGGESNARQTKLDPNDVAPEGYSVANVGAGVALATGPRVVHVDVSLRNVFNREYQSFLSRYKFAADPEVLDPGRNLTLRVSTDF